MKFATILAFAGVSQAVRLTSMVQEDNDRPDMDDAKAWFKEVICGDEECDNEEIKQAFHAVKGVIGETVKNADHGEYITADGKVDIGKAAEDLSAQFEEESEFVQAHHGHIIEAVKEVLAKHGNPTVEELKAMAHEFMKHFGDKPKGKKGGEGKKGKPAMAQLKNEDRPDKEDVKKWFADHFCGGNPEDCDKKAMRAAFKEFRRILGDLADADLSQFAGEDGKVDVHGAAEAFAEHRPNAAAWVQEHEGELVEEVADLLDQHDGITVGELHELAGMFRDAM